MLRLREPGDNPLHLLRALLRECTYLPDPAAREYMHKHIFSRYRVYCPRPSRYTPSTPNLPRNSALFLVRQLNLLQTAQDGLALLQRANNGHIRALTKVLGLTYGRTGKRRYELLQPLLAPDTPSDQKAVASLSASLTITAPLQVPPMLQALIKSQTHQKQTDLLKHPIKQTEPRVPRSNIWRRSVPIKRLRNIEKRWYQMILERIMPPLPKEEWERLRRLANGEMRWEGPVNRRARVPDTTEDYMTLDPERGSLIEDLDNAMYLRTRGPTDSPHRITGRLMRRLWAQIFPICPLMRWNAKRKSWYFQWGDIRPAPGSSQLTAFKGVDEDGRILHRHRV